MTINKEELDLYYYNNPDAIQQDILNTLSNITKGKVVNINKNTTFGFFVDSFTTITSNIVKGIEDKFNSIYPRRSQSLEDLFQHISDFDYISLQANPASLTVKITIAKHVLFKTVVPYDNFYNAIVIPKDTIFKVGTLDFGIYYDIFIKVNKITNNIIITYDTSSNNSLHQLKNYNIPYNEYKYEGVEYIEFELPIFQFTKFTSIENIDNTLSYTKKFNIDDKFYAIRVFDIINGFEFKYTLSDIVYDPYKPTCIIKNLLDTNQLIINIPQIYFSNNQISNKLYIEIYTTKGKLDMNIDNTNLDLIKCKFIYNSTLRTTDIQPQVDALKKINNFIILPISNKIVGGKDLDTFNQIKNKVIYNLFSNRVLISNKDIQNYFESYGYQIMYKIDNLTNRVFNVMKYITDQNQKKMLVTNSKIYIDINNLDQYMNTIKKLTDKNIVILPNTIFKYEIERNLAIPLSSSEYNTFKNLSISKKIDMLNSQELLFYPYHLKIDLTEKYPKGISYDLLSCEFTQFNFGNKHPYNKYQTYINDFQIVHLNQGCGGYKIYIGIKRNDQLKEIPRDGLYLYLYLVTIDNKLIGKELTYESTQDDLDIYSVVLDTNYRLENNQIAFQNIDYQLGYTGDILVPMITKAFLVSHIKSMYLDGNDEYQPYDIFNQHEYRDLFNYFLNNYITNEYIPTEIYNFEIKFGESLDDIIDNNLLINYTKEEYEVYESDIPLTYDHDIYAKDAQGKLIYTIENDELKLTKLHSQGDIVTDDQGNIVYKYKKGDIKIDALGRPIIKKSRQITTNIDAFLFSYKYKLISDFNIFNMLETLNSYYNEVRDHRNKLYGNTLCYFKPMSTLGRGLFYINDTNNTSYINLNVKVGFKLYVKQDVLNDTTLTKYISDNIPSIISDMLNSNIISLYKIADTIKSTFNEYIEAIDIKGFNDDQNLQTIIKFNEDYNININQKLLLDNSSSKIILIDDVDLEYIPV